MENRTKVIILWNMLVVCMILHFNYHVSGIFYGINVEKPDADGTFPSGLVVIRILFQHLPLLYAAGLLLWESRPVRLGNLVLSGLYALANAFHLAGELVRPPVDPSQAILLSVTLLLSIVSVLLSYRWHRESKITFQSTPKVS